MITTMFVLSLLTGDTNALVNDPEAPVPAGWRVENRANTGLWVAGMSVFLAGYTTSIITTAAFGRGYGAIPLAGPVLDMLFPNSLLTWLLQPIAGVAQLVGSIMFIVGVAQRRPTLIKDKNSVVVAPVIQKGFYGLSLSGAF